MIAEIVDEMNKCLENDLHLAALALALTLPDICGKAEFPEKSTSKRYIEWYDRHIGYAQREMSLSDNEELADLPYISGELLYQLRCSFLHSGDTDFKKECIKEEQNKLSSFNLLLLRHDDNLPSGTESLITYGKSGEVKERSFEVNVTFLCKMLTKGALDYYKSNEQLFSFFTYNIIDRTTRMLKDTGMN